MKNVLLQRICASEQGTFGALSMDGIPLCVTCELPWRQNRRNVSCIPAGRYAVEPYNSAKYHNVWQLLDVPNRSGILIHVGNTIDDIEGCILVGHHFGEVRNKPAVMASAGTIQVLREILPDEFWLEVNDINNQQ